MTQQDFSNVARKVLKRFRNPEIGADGCVYRNPQVFLDLAQDKQPLGRVVVQLLPNQAPISSANFLSLCEGTSLDNYGKPLHFRGSTLFRVVPKYCVCGGDLINNNGTSGKSIYGGKLFRDEKTGLSHDTPGTLSMLQQAGQPNTNGSQFFVVLCKAVWLDDIYVPFGRVVEGLDMLTRLSTRYGQDSGTPLADIRVFDCGVI